MVGDDVGGDEVERRRVVRRRPAWLDAWPDLGQPELRGVTAIIDTISACTFAGTAEVATGALAGRIPIGGTSSATRPNTEPTPMRVSARRVGATAW